MACLAWPSNQAVVIWRFRFVAPKIPITDRHRPDIWTNQPVGPVEASDDAMRSAWSRSVALPLVMTDASTADGTGKCPAQKTDPAVRKNKIAGSGCGMLGPRQHGPASMEAKFGKRRRNWTCRADSPEVLSATRMNRHGSHRSAVLKGISPPPRRCRERMAAKGAPSIECDPTFSPLCRDIWR